TNNLIFLSHTDDSTLQGLLLLQQVSHHVTLCFQLLHRCLNAGLLGICYLSVSHNLPVPGYCARGETNKEPFRDAIATIGINTSCPPVRWCCHRVDPTPRGLNGWHGCCCSA